MEMFAINMINIVVNGYITIAVMILCLFVYSPLAGVISSVGVVLSAFFLHMLEKQSKKMPRSIRRHRMIWWKALNKSCFLYLL